MSGKDSGLSTDASSRFAAMDGLDPSRAEFQSYSSASPSVPWGYPSGYSSHFDVHNHRDGLAHAMRDLAARRPSQTTGSTTSPRVASSHPTCPLPPGASNALPAGTPRTRITRACDACRRKKIKCDLSDGHPCTTCRQYQWECTFNDTTKKRGPPKGYIESLENRLKKMEQLLEQMHTNKKRKRSPSREPSRPSSCISSDTVEENKADDADESAPKKRFEDKVARFHGSSSGLSMMDQLLSSSKRDSDSRDFYEKYHKLRTLDNDIVIVRDPTDVEIKDRTLTDEQLSGTSDLLPDHVLSALIYRFFNGVHLTLPIFDRQEFMDAFEGRRSPPPPLILICALCAYTCFIMQDGDPIFKENKLDRSKLFQSMAERASSLVRQEYLAARVETIQALVLLCAQPATTVARSRNWILGGLAVRMSQDLGFHRALATPISPMKAELRKRLWYCVYIADRWNAAALGRPMAIADADCDVGLPLIHGHDHQSDYSVFVHFAKLTIILGEVLRLIYSPFAKKRFKTTSPAPVVNSVQRMLNAWYADLPPNCQVSYAQLKSLTDPDDPKRKKGVPMMFCYYAVTLMLYRPFIVSEADAPELFAEASQRCIDVATTIVDMARVMYKTDPVQFGYSYVGVALFQATLVHVFNSLSTDPKVASQARHYVDLGCDTCLAYFTEIMPNMPVLQMYLHALVKMMKRASRHGTTDDDAQHEEQQRSPMSVDRIVCGHGPQPSPVSQDKPTSSSSSPSPLSPSLVPDTNEKWHELFSTAGAPFGDFSTLADINWE